MPTVTSGRRDPCGSSPGQDSSGGYRTDSVTLVGLGWFETSGQDIHLLPGLASPEFTRVLRAFDQDPISNTVLIKQLHEMTGLTMTFTVQLAGTPASHGLAIKNDTGEISVDAGASLTTRGHSFLVTATATIPATSGQPEAKASTRIRVYVHGAILRMWLTPDPLTVRNGAKNMRSSVLALFDDGVIGDITHWCPFETPMGPSDHTYVHRAGQDDPVLSWKSDNDPVGGPAVISVHAQTGVLTATSNAGRAKITVTGPSATATGFAVCAPGWSTPVKLEVVAGPGHREMNFVPNLLFLPEGFTTDEKRGIRSAGTPGGKSLVEAEPHPAVRLVHRAVQLLHRVGAVAQARRDRARGTESGADPVRHRRIGDRGRPPTTAAYRQRQVEPQRVGQRDRSAHPGRRSGRQSDQRRPDPGLAGPLRHLRHSRADRRCLPPTGWPRTIGCC